MPNIDTFNDKQPELHPQEGGAQAWEQAGYRVGRYYNQIGEEASKAITQYQDHVTKQQTLTGIKNETAQALQDDLAWKDAVSKDASAPTHDPTLYQKFRESITQRQQDQEGQFTTDQAKNLAVERNERYLRDWDKRGVSDVSDLAGHQSSLDNQQAARITVGRASVLGMHGLPGLMTDLDNQATAAKAASGGSIAAIEQIDAHTQRAKEVAAVTAAKTDLASSTDPVAMAARIVNDKTFLSVAGEHAPEITAEGERFHRARLEDIDAAERHKKLEQEKTSDEEVTRIRESVIGAGSVYTNQKALTNPKLTQRGVEEIKALNRDAATGDPVIQQRNAGPVLEAARKARDSNTPLDLGKLAEHVNTTGPDSITLQTYEMAKAIMKGEDGLGKLPAWQKDARLAQEKLWDQAGATTGNAFGGAARTVDDRGIAAQAHTYYDGMDQTLYAQGIPPSVRYADPYGGKTPNSIYYGKPISAWNGTGTALHPAATGKPPTTDEEARAVWTSLGH